MEATLEEIRNLFNGMSSCQYSKIVSIAPYKAWAFKDNGDAGVLIPYDGELVNEEFSSINLTVVNKVFGSGLVRCLSLSCSYGASLWEFATVCANFIDPGVDGKYRKEITDNPIEWWNRWKLLLGNSVIEPNIHAVLGELTAYYYFLTRMPKVEKLSWRGPSMATHDFTADGIEYEVKSTTRRGTLEISASNKYQFVSGSTPLELILCEFEQSDNGYNIDDMVMKLANLHADYNDLNTKLAKLGYKIGRNSRKTRYKLLSMKRYVIDDSFPYIDIADIDRTGKGRISQVSYTIDLAGLEREDIHLDL